MSVKKKFEYIEIEDNLNFPFIELKKGQEFVKLAESVNAQFIFMTHDKLEPDLSCFLFLHNNIIYKLKRKGFETLADYLESEKNGFPNATEYYEAKKNDINEYKVYLEYKKLGTGDKLPYIKARKLGFIENYDRFIVKIKKGSRRLPRYFNISQLSDGVKLYKYAVKEGYKNFKDFQDALFAGFTDSSKFEDAKSKGFTYAGDYSNATRMGFSSASDYIEAKRLKISNKKEFELYAKIKNLAKNKFSFDQAELVDELKNFENGKKISISKLLEILKEITDRNKIIKANDGNKYLPKWYTRKLDSIESIESFLTNTKEIEEIGFFDKEGEYFAVSRLSDKSIYLDGSNVAYGTTEKNKKSKPRYSNIILMAKKLKRLRFREILVIADASLKHKVADPGNFKELDKLVTYLESPSNSTADEFLIETVKKDLCPIITNDTFKDWKEKDKWLKKNIDTIRIPFMIIDNEVSLPALERDK